VKTPALLVLALLLTGCGGDGDDAKTKAEFIRQAEAICVKANADQKKLPAPTAPESFASYVTGVVRIAKTATAQLTALDQPEGDQEELRQKVFTPLQQQLDLAERYQADVAAAVKAKDNAALLRLGGDPPNETKADLRWMKSYGFDACVEAADTTD
jgi:hypothetical protein